MAGWDDEWNGTPCRNFPAAECAIIVFYTAEPSEDIWEFKICLRIVRHYVTLAASPSLSLSLLCFISYILITFFHSFFLLPTRWQTRLYDFHIIYKDRDRITILSEGSILEVRGARVAGLLKEASLPSHFPVISGLSCWQWECGSRGKEKFERDERRDNSVILPEEMWCLNFGQNYSYNTLTPSWHCGKTKVSMSTRNANYVWFILCGRTKNISAPEKRKFHSPFPVISYSKRRLSPEEYSSSDEVNDYLLNVIIFSFWIKRNISIWSGMSFHARYETRQARFAL